jgi:mannosyl-3-phosphoglycerate phosphatase
MRTRDAELARSREFDEPFYFTSADEPAIARFVEAAQLKGYSARQGGQFWNFSSGCDPARAVRNLTELFREATRTKLRAVGIGAGAEDIPWLQAMDQAILLPAGRAVSDVAKSKQSKAIIPGTAPGPVGWNEAILNIIR